MLIVSIGDIEIREVTIDSRRILRRNELSREAFMTEIKCSVSSCRYHNDDDSCNKDQFYVSIDEVYTASGFHPICSDYSEGNEDD